MKTKKEYYLVNEISKLKKMSARNVRAIIAKLNEEKSDNMIRKANDGLWEVHHLLLPKFNKQRCKTNSYYALTIDPVSNISERDLQLMMYYISETITEPNFEINYVVEPKVSNGRNHIHAYIKTQKIRRISSAIHSCFLGSSYKLKPVFDLEGWREYITKTGAQIITLN